jgi:hypothetical protein
MNATNSDLTPEQFDSLEPQITNALGRWWEEEAQTFDAAIAGTGSVWEGLPEIDSKAVVKASPVIRRFLGIDLDPRLIRRGGYRSLEDLTNDLVPKLRARCAGAPTAPPPQFPSAESNMESINVRRS